MFLRFEIFRDVIGQYRWRLISPNGEKIAASEGYISKQNAIHTANRIRLLAQGAKLIDKTI